MSDQSVLTQPTQVVCPTCLSTIPSGIPICPQCGAAMPPPAYPSMPPSAPPKKSRTGLMIAILLIVVIAVGALAYVGYVVVQNNQAQILQAAKATDQGEASNAPSQLVLTCLTVRNDNSTLRYYQGSGFSGYSTIIETVGVSNPTRFVIDVRWTLTLDFPHIGWDLSNSVPFHLSSNSVGHPTFNLQISAAQYNSLPAHPDTSGAFGTMDESYSVTGTYATYNFTHQSTYDSSTNTGTGAFASSGGNLPQC